MKYTFETEIEKGESGAFIDIPFNVWEICKREGEVPVKVRVGETIFVCNLEPKKNGYYNIPIQHDIMEKLSYDTKYKVSFRITKTSVGDSPYSTSNPIRKIDHIDCIIQPHDGLCGQSCIAMLAGITLDDAINVMHCNEWQATIAKMINALNYFGLEHSEEIIYTCGEADVTLPKCAIILEKMGRYSHYLIAYDGKYYDSNLGVLDRYDMTKMKGYLEVLV
ncbi:MAG: DUF1905 domain-containing protein [Lachnospiraceae bacterium]|nr:DUF1905 domain-containing protein [Lachnospiraceae bacterium]